MSFREKFKEKRTIASKWLLYAIISFPVLMIGIKHFGITINSEWSLAIIASIISATLIEILENTSEKNKIRLYKEQDDVYNYMINCCDKEHFKEAIFIQYSGKKATKLISKLNKRKTRIKLFVKHPDTAVNTEQKKRIESVIESMPTDLGKECGTSIDIIAYKTDASIRAVMLDDKIIVFGWYIFENKNKPNPKFPEDTVNLWGHNMPGIILHKGSVGFNDAAYFFHNTVKNLEKHGELLS